MASSVVSLTRVDTDCIDDSREGGTSAMQWEEYKEYCGIPHDAIMLP